MEAFERIQLAFKCPKALDDLQPCQNNWYCDSCQNMVYDFRGMAEEEILATFAKSGQKLCGIYDAGQIKVLPQKPKWYKWIPAAMITLGITVLNGCSWGQKNKQHTMIGEVGVKKPVDTHTLGIVLPTQPDSATIGKVLIKKSIASHDLKVEPYNQEKPQYPGGDVAFDKYMATEIKNPKNQSGRALVQFTIEKDGLLTQIKIVRGINIEVDQQIISALRHIKKWQPAYQNGLPIRTQLVMPVAVVGKK